MTREEAYDRLYKHVNYECYNGYDVPEEEINEELEKIESGYYDDKIVFCDEI